MLPCAVSGDKKKMVVYHSILVGNEPSGPVCDMKVAHLRCPGSCYFTSAETHQTTLQSEKWGASATSAVSGATDGWKIVLGKRKLLVLLLNSFFEEGQEQQLSMSMLCMCARAGEWGEDRFCGSILGLVHWTTAQLLNATQYGPGSLPTHASSFSLLSRI